MGSVWNVAFIGVQRVVQRGPKLRCDVDSTSKADRPVDSQNVPYFVAIAWCAAMLDNDRTGFIASKQLESLRKHLESGL
jgi:hypothetical protein